MDLKAERGPDRARHKVSISERCQIDQPDAMFVFGNHSLGDGEGDRRFADTSPGPITVTRRCRDSREISVSTACSRPIIRVTASGKLCFAIESVAGCRVSDGASMRIGATKL